MAIKEQKINPENDLGFGPQPVIKSQPLINKDGSVNVRRKGLAFFNTADNYHTLITMSWGRFWFIVLSGYLFANLFFATIYVLIGMDSLDGANSTNGVGHFLDAFFFSAQTISTVGYGHISPKGVVANSVAAIESMMGLLAFRISNLRRNVLIDLDVEVVFSYNEIIDGKATRRFFPLELERSKVSILTLNWTIVHPLDENSPLADITPDELERTQASFSVLLKAFDDTFSQTVHSRTSYTYADMVWDAKFAPMFERDEDGRIVLDMSKISMFGSVVH
jgi:inward rectifier potassium channel